MAKIRKHLANAPVKEAIIDLRTSVPEAFDHERFQELKDVLSQDYPEVREQPIMQAKIKLQVGEPAGHTTQLGAGLRFASRDGKQIAQFRTDGFTVNRLRQYTSWTKLFPEAMKLWAHYVNITNVDHVSRVAVRYINRIDLTLPVTDYADHFTAPPDIPAGLPQQLRGFLYRIFIEDDETNTLASVTQALEPGLDEQTVSVILDIDVYQQGDFSTDAAELTPIFEKLRSLKNRIFFGFLTEDTVARYDK